MRASASPVATLRGTNSSFKSSTYDDRGVYALLWRDRGAGGWPIARASRDTTYGTYRQRSAHWANAETLRTAIEGGALTHVGQGNVVNDG
jgi:hypothetical protein